MKSDKFAQLQRGVVVEFDFAVLDGHAALVTACNRRLKQEGIQLEAPLMMHLMGGKSFKNGLKSVAKHCQKNFEVEEVVAGCTEEYIAELTRLLKGDRFTDFQAFVKEALAQNLSVVLLTQLESDIVMEALKGLHHGKLRVFRDVSNNFGFASWESWRRASRKNDMHERICAAVAGSGLSARAALKLGMNIIAKIGASNEYQDFSGSNVYVNEFSAELVGEIKELLDI